MLNMLSEILKMKSPAIHTVSPETSVADAVRQMNAHKMGCLLVTEGERLVGIFTERDVLVRVVGAELDPKSTPLSEVMTPDPFCVNPLITVESAMHVITEKRVRHLPVVEEDRLVGMISIGDIARWLTRAQKGQMEEMIRAVKNVMLT